MKNRSPAMILRHVLVVNSMEILKFRVSPRHQLLHFLIAIFLLIRNAFLVSGNFGIS